MTEAEECRTCFKFLQDLKAKGKVYSKFEESLKILQAYAASKGLEDKDMDLLASVIMDTDLSVTRLVSLAKCLIPRNKVPGSTVRSIVKWCLASINELPISLSITIIQWIIGIWDFQLVERKILNMYYCVFFHVMLKKEKLEKHIAALIYVLTKPENVTRRQVSMLLTLHEKYSKPQKHLLALLSLFKSYKPELVPEKIQSVNMESVRRPIAEDLRVMLQNAKTRTETQQTENYHKFDFKWCTREEKNATMAPLLPSVGYFQIGSCIFKEKETKSIFDISSIEELGKLQLRVELPCNAVSLLSNTAGHHLLTFGDFQYQSRFSYNLYNTLIKAFILENDKFSDKQLEKLLDMTAEFSRYMQRGISVVNRFLDEYLYLNSGEYLSKLLTLLQWMTSIPMNHMQQILVHVRQMFYESTLTMKCEIIGTLRNLVTNLFVIQKFDEHCEKTAALFLGQCPVDKFEDTVLVVSKFCEALIVTGLNIHDYNILLLSEALSFYEQVYMLESQTKLFFFIFPPPAVIYAGFVTTSCAILTRICALLSRYRDPSMQLKNEKVQNMLKRRMRMVDLIGKEIVKTLLCDEPFKKRDTKYFFKNIPEQVLLDLESCNPDCLLNINNHLAILPYKCVLNQTGLVIKTKEDATYMALHYYPAVYEFLKVFQS